MTSYLDRIGARNFLRDKGVILGDTALANLASDGKGPRYSIINGRALYQADDLDNWVTRQASAEPRSRRRTASTVQASSPWVQVG